MCVDWWNSGASAANVRCIVCCSLYRCIFSESLHSAWDSRYIIVSHQTKAWSSNAVTFKCCCCCELHVNCVVSRVEVTLAYQLPASLRSSRRGFLLAVRMIISYWFWFNHLLLFLSWNWFLISIPNNIGKWSSEGSYLTLSTAYDLHQQIESAQLSWCLQNLMKHIFSCTEHIKRHKRKWWCALTVHHPQSSASFKANKQLMVDYDNSENDPPR